MKEARKDVLIGLLAALLTGAILAGSYFLLFEMGRSAAVLGGRVRIGEPAPGFTLARHGGGEVSLEELRGQPVVLNFWSAGCATCLEELDELVRFYRAHLGEVAFFAINMGDPPETVAEFARRHKLESEYPLLLDPKGKVAVAYGVTGVPETVFIDAEGIVRYWIIGPASERQLEEGLRSIVQVQTQSRSGSESER